MKIKRIDDGIKRAALYARVSTEEQAMHGVSLDAQKERLTQYAKDNGLSIVDIYVDEGISARKRYTRRAEFMRMLEDVKANKIDVVLFIKLDRWFRNIADYYEVQAILDKYKVQWIATEEDYDTTTANGRLALNIKLAIAQDESDRTSERIKFVFQNMVKEGRVISGSTSLGYEIVNKKVVVNEKEAEIVRNMFLQFIDCRSIKATSRYILNAYNKNIDVKSMKRMLSNPWYIGEAYGIKDWCPAIVDKSTFELANQILEVRSARYDGTRTDRVYLFTGLVFCGCCGRRMTTYSCGNKNRDGSMKSSYTYYRCPAHTTGVCDMSKQINQDFLENWICQNLHSIVDEHNVSLRTAQLRRKKKAIDVAKINAKLEKLKDLYLSDLLSRSAYEQDYRALTALLKEAEADEKENERKPIDTSFLSEFDSLYTTLEPKDKKAFWSRIIRRILVTPDGNILVSLNET